MDSAIKLLEKLSTNLLPLLFPCPVPTAPSGSLCGAIAFLAFISLSPFFSISPGLACSLLSPAPGPQSVF